MEQVFLEKVSKWIFWAHLSSILIFLGVSLFYFLGVGKQFTDYNQMLILTLFFGPIARLCGVVVLSFTNSYYFFGLLALGSGIMILLRLFF